MSDTKEVQGLILKATSAQAVSSAVGKLVVMLLNSCRPKSVAIPVSNSPLTKYGKDLSAASHVTHKQQHFETYSQVH